MDRVLPVGPADAPDHVSPVVSPLRRPAGCMRTTGGDPTDTSSSDSLAASRRARDASI